MSMRKMVLPLIVALALTAIASAGPNDVLYRGKFYRDATVTEIDGDTVRISSRDGDAKVPWLSLPSTLRKENEAEYLELKRQATQPAPGNAALSPKQAIEKIRSMGVQVKVRVRQVTEDGILGDAQYIARNTVKEMVEAPGTALDREKRKVPVQNTYASWQTLGNVFVKGPGHNIADGETWEGTVWPAGTFRYTATTGAIATVRQYVTTAEEAIAIAAKSR